MTADLPFLSGGGEMGALMRALDWSKSSLGTPKDWPQALRTAVRLILNTRHPMYVWWGRELACLYNDAYRQSIGPERHPVSLGRPAREVWEEIWDVIGPQIAYVMEGRGATWHQNALVPITRNGRREDVYWTYSYSPIDDDTAPHRVGGVLVICTETTETVMAQQRRGAELEDQRHREEQLRLATEAAEIGLWDVDTRTDTLFWPPRVKAMFGISPHVPVTMKDFYAGLHPEDRAHTSAAFASALDSATRAVYDVEYRTIGKEDGIVRWVAAKGRAIFAANGECIRVIGTAIDISARKRSEARLRELNETLERRVSEALAEQRILARVFERTDAWILVVDLNYRLLAINKAAADGFEHLYGGALRVGESLLESVPDRASQRADVKAAWDRALAGESYVSVQELGDASLQRRSFETRFEVLRDAHGTQIGAVQFAYDVTERLRDQARLAEAENYVRQTQKYEAIGQLTGGIAHDFNNLLQVIAGGIGVLERQTYADSGRRMLEGMRRAATRGASLTRQLLAFSRRQALQPEPVDLARQIERMRDILDRTLRGDVVVQTGLPQDLWPVLVDPNELELAVLNLCVNARDAMPKGGTISIEAENHANMSREELSGDFVTLSIRDTGTGMSKDVMEHIFEPFFTTKDLGKGSGLGLAQVYGFARQSGGAVSVESTLGSGTNVTLALPRSERQPTPAILERALGAASTDKTFAGSVLLVEDDEEVARLVGEMLRELGYSVTRAASAEAALGALADARPVDVVVSDIMMPGTMNGFGLAREIRRRRPQQNILLTSGYPEAAGASPDSGDLVILAKPYEIQDLKSALERTLSQARAPNKL